MIDSAFSTPGRPHPNGRLGVENPSKVYHDEIPRNYERYNKTQASAPCEPIPANRIVAAERFDVLDSAGKVVASISASRQGYPTIGLTFAENPECVASLTMTRDGSMTIGLGGRAQGFSNSIVLSKSLGAMNEISENGGLANIAFGIDENHVPYASARRADGTKCSFVCTPEKKPR